MLIRIRNIERLTGLLTLLGVFILAYGVYLGYHEVEFTLGGAQTIGTVVDTTQEAPSSGGSAGADQPTYNVVYTFTPEGRGSVISGSDIIGSDQWASLRIGGPITVQYVRSDPATNRAADNAPLVVLAVVVLTGAGFAVVGGWLFWGVYGQSRLRSRLLVRGVRGTGTVIDPRAAVGFFSGQADLRLRYRYTDRAGRDWTGLSGWLPRAEAGRWRAGAAVHILYDPARPSRSVWLGETDPAAN